jgi:hypothetical protein
MPDGPSGKTANQCPALNRKIFRFTFDPNHFYIHRRPGPHRGAFRDRHGRRAGDAVDAGSAAQTFCADEALNSRTAKSCGPYVQHFFLTAEYRLKRIRTKCLVGIRQ